MKLVNNKILLLVICYQLFLAMIGMAKSYTPIPAWDMWDSYVKFIALYDSGEKIELFRLNNEHPILLSKITFLADYYLFGSSFISLYILNFISMVALATTVIAVIEENKKSSKYDISIAVKLFAAAALMSWAQYTNLTIPFQAAFIWSYSFPLLSIYLILYGKGKIFNSEFGLFLSSVSSLTMVNAIIVWPICFAIYINIKGDKKSIKSIMASIFVYSISILMILNGMQGIAEHSKLAVIRLADITDIILFVFTLIGGLFIILQVVSYLN